MNATSRIFLFALFCSAAPLWAAETRPVLKISTPMAAPAWAKLERQLLADNAPACREFFEKYYNPAGELQAFLRWGANDGADDAFENFNRWPELHALGASDEVLQLYLKAQEGMIRQYSAAKTIDVPAGRNGMYIKEFSAQADWMHHGEGLQIFNRMNLSVPNLPVFQTRARRFAGFYMGTDPSAPNYDPEKKIIRSMQNGSIGPMLRPATPLDWVGDPFDAAGFVALHGESTYQQFLEHYREYTEVLGDHFINLVATTLPTTAYLVKNEAVYKTWIVDYMDAWLARMKANGGVIPSHIGLDGKIGGADGKWWRSAYGWGFSPVNPVNGRRENRNRIPRATVGFANALLVTGDQRYADAWRTMMDAVNSHARTTDGKKEYPTMYGDAGWYGWQARPWNVGALELWIWSMRADDLARVDKNEWLTFLAGQQPDYPATALQRDLDAVAKKVAAIRADKTPATKRLADNMLDLNPATPDTLVRLMLGGIPPGVAGGLLQARLRYFDPVRQRAGIPEDVAALVSELSDTRTVVTLVNLSTTAAHTVIVQGGAYGEHRIEAVEQGGATTRVAGTHLTVELAPGAGAKLTLTMKRFAATPTAAFPWERN